MRCIDADSLEELFREVIGGIAKKPEMDGNLEHMVRASAMVIEMIQDAPTIEPERKTGKWIDAVLPNDNGGLPVQVCDQCNTFFPLAYTGGGHHYCPNCGARLEGEGC